MKVHPELLQTLARSPAWMTPGERLVLYSLVLGLRPRRVLEIGTFKGGSTLIVAAALDDLGEGRIVCVDPAPQIDPTDQQSLATRATILAEPSPEALPSARAAAGGPFDFALIDGDHTFEGVSRDLEGVLEVMADQARILLHDAHYFEVSEAIDAWLARHPGELTDAGLVSVEATPHGEPVDGREIFWGGLRLIIYRTRR
jgi:predicted O-methyltransferase YrrM